MDRNRTVHEPRPTSKWHLAAVALLPALLAIATRIAG